MKYVLSLITLVSFSPLHSMNQSDHRAYIILSAAVKHKPKEIYCYTCKEVFVRESSNYWDRYIICHECHKNFKNWHELAEHQLASLHIPADTRHSPILNDLISNLAQ